MELCRTSNTGFQKDYIIEEKLTANYIKNVGTGFENKDFNFGKDCFFM
jgi:hypothetical protein